MIKKLLFLLLPFVGFSQTKLVQSWQSDLSNIMVGDTIIYQLDLVDITGNDIRTLQVDLSVDRTKLTPIGTPTWNSQFSGMSTNFNQWSNYDYNSALNGTDANDLDAQYLEGLGGKYAAGTHYILRPSMQSTADIDGTLFTQKFKVEEAADYSGLVKLNWAYARDVNYVTITDIVGDPASIDVTENVGGSPAGTITFQLQSPNANNATDYVIILHDNVIQVDRNNDGIMDGWEPNYQNSQQIQGTFDASGRFTSTELKQGVKYWVDVFVNSTWDNNSNRQIGPDWLDDVVTVSDLYLVFQQAMGGGVDGSTDIFTYDVQEMLGNVSNDMRRNASNGDVVKRIDIDDAYVLLAHLTGVLPNSADYNYYDQPDLTFYPISSVNNGSMNYGGLLSAYGLNDNSQGVWEDGHIFELADNEAVTINLAHGLWGDANLSHSTTPTLNDDTKMIRTSDVITMARTAPRTSMFDKEAVNLDLDVISEIKNGKVELTVNLAKQDLSGMQFNISYDSSRITLDDVVFDTGNTMTNFAKKVDDTRLNFGTIDPKGQSVMKTGKPFKLVFTPKVTLQNTIGLITFRVTDAVQKDGTKVNLKLN